VDSASKQGLNVFSTIKRRIPYCKTTKEKWSFASFWRTNQILVSSKGKHRDLDFVQMLFEEKGTSPVAQPAITECGRKL